MIKFYRQFKRRLLAVFTARLDFYRQCQCGWRSFILALLRLAPKTRAGRITLIAAPLLIVVAILMYGYYIPSSQVFGKVYYKGKTSQKEVALTFDDGPNDPYTSQILDVLEQYQVRATFFEIGQNVEANPETAIRQLADGDVIGNHSYSHNANHALTTYGENDMRHGEEAIYNTLGIKPYLYRPPHGKLSPWEIHYVHNMGMIEVTWTIESAELAGWSGAQEAQYIVSKVGTKNGSGDIILLHDGYGTEHNDKHSDKSAAVEAVKIIIPELEAEGYIFVTVPELLGTPSYLP